MGSRLARTLGGLAVTLSTACAPGSTTGDGVIDEDAPAPLDARTFDAGTPRADAVVEDRVAPPDRVVQDLGARPDLATTPDVFVARDVVSVTDLGPADVGCVLPPPVARPPAPGPDGSEVVRALAAEHPDWLRDSCVAMGGTHRFLFEALRRGRAVDPRWGLDRRNGPLSGDIVTYFYGDGCPEGRREVYMFDVITRLCAQPGVDEPAAPGWIDRSSEGGRLDPHGLRRDAAARRGSHPRRGRRRRPTRPRRAAARRPRHDARPWPASAPTGCGTPASQMGATTSSSSRWCVGCGASTGAGASTGSAAASATCPRTSSTTSTVRAARPMEGSLDTYVVDVIVGHCGPTPRHRLDRPDRRRRRRGALDPRRPHRPLTCA
jgi:hypothetical protein